MIFLKIFYKFCRHFLSAQHTGGFGVHSPFVFKFIENVLVEKYPFYVFNQIEGVRKSLQANSSVLEIKDFGTGHDRISTVSNVANHSLKSKKYGQLLFRIVRYFNCKNVLELGTSLGVTTAYLSSVSKDIQCVTLEGCPQIANVAKDNFQYLGLNNIDLLVGDIDLLLPNVISQSLALDFVFIDANHRYGSVMNYFNIILSKVHNSTVVVIDDIYWSDDMEKAWNEIKSIPQVTTSIDLFDIGIVFFNIDLNKKHYKIRY